MKKMTIYMPHELASGLDFEIPTATHVRERIENALYCAVGKMQVSWSRKYDHRSYLMEDA